MSGRVLVTGATGYLGRHILEVMHASGMRAAALVRNPRAWPVAWASDVGDVALVSGSPIDHTSWLNAASKLGVDTIIHTAGIVHHSRHDADEMMHFNVESALQVVRAARQLGARVVLVSSSGTVGCFRYPGVAATEDTPTADAVIAKWPYYVSKLRAEQQAAALAAKLGVTITTVRLPVLLGPGDHRLRSTGHVTRALTGRVPFIPPGGMHFADVRDVAAALSKTTELATWRDSYHLPGWEMSLGDFFQMVSEVSGTAVTKRRVPAWLLTSVARGTQVLPVRGLPDPVVLEMASHYWGMATLWSHDELGYQSRAARQTLSDTVAWLRVHHPELATQATHQAA